MIDDMISLTLGVVCAVAFIAVAFFGWEPSSRSVASAAFFGAAMGFINSVLRSKA